MKKGRGQAVHKEQTNRQTDRQTYRQTDRLSFIYIRCHDYSASGLWLLSNIPSTKWHIFTGDEQ